MIYVYSDILERMIYTVDVGADTTKAAELAKKFKEMDRVTQEYTIGMMQAWMDQQQEANPNSGPVVSPSNLDV